MTRLPFLLLGLVAAGFSAVIVKQFEGEPMADLPLSNASRRPAAPPTPAAAPTVDRSGEWIATSLARPLFSPDRRPPPAEAGASTALAFVELPRLTGILITPDERRAIFGGPREPLVLQEGGRIGGYLVQSISAAQVTVLGPSGARTLQPSYDARTPGGERGAAASAETSFDAKPNPSGLDILRNAAQQDAQVTGGAPVLAPVPPGDRSLPEFGPPGILGIARTP